MTQLTFAFRRVALLGAVAMGAASLATPAFAQAPAAATPAATWQPWVGCWQPADATAPDAKPTTLCVTPTSPSAVEIATITDDSVTRRDTIDASGAARDIEKDGCKGSQSGEWSADGHRVYLKSTITCNGGLAQTNAGLLAISPTGEWLDIRTMTVAGNTLVRSVRYRDVSAAATNLPAEFAKRAESSMAASGARTAAGGLLDIGAIVETVRHTDTSATQAWIIGRGARFQLDGKKLVHLADAGIPSSVIDVMVGMSYPEHFALAAREQAPAVGDMDMNPASFSDERLRMACLTASPMRMDSPELYDTCISRYGYGSVGRYMYDSYWLGYGAGYGGYYGLNYMGYGYPGSYGYGVYSPYYGYGYSGYVTAPTVVVKGSEPEPHGRVVNGRGYAKGSGASGSSGSARPSGNPPRSREPSSSSSGSGSSGSSSGGSSAGSSSGAASTGRTAHPRPPR